MMMGRTVKGEEEREEGDEETVDLFFGRLDSIFQINMSLPLSFIFSKQHYTTHRSTQLTNSSQCQDTHSPAL